MLVHWIWLATRGNMGEQMKRTLLEYFHDAEDIFYATEDMLAQVENMTEQYTAALSDKNLDDAWKIIDQCNRKAIHILTYRDAGYPGRLRNISDPPMVLY